MSFILDTAESITQTLDDLIDQICPQASRRAMYGGIVFELESGRHDTMVCGHFVYKQHVSLEFSKGYKLEGFNDVLEGAGKYRRHIKLKCVDDIERLCVRPVLEQAFGRQQNSS